MSYAFAAMMGAALMGFTKEETEYRMGFLVASFLFALAAGVSGEAGF